jgi:HNH endonuclease
MNPNYPLVSARARHICEYCHAPEVVFNLPFEIEHIAPQSRGGAGSEENLALACRSCNLYKSDLTTGIDSETNGEVQLFNPRVDDWSEHFLLNSETGEIEALSAIGRATIMRLRINSRSQVSARRQWVTLGLMQ